jgi:hypothetical protein
MRKDVRYKRQDMQSLAESPILDMVSYGQRDGNQVSPTGQVLAGSDGMQALDYTCLIRLAGTSTYRVVEYVVLIRCVGKVAARPSHEGCAKTAQQTSPHFRCEAQSRRNHLRMCFTRRQWLEWLSANLRCLPMAHPSLLTLHQQSAPTLIHRHTLSWRPFYILYTTRKNLLMTICHVSLLATFSWIRRSNVWR